MSFIVALFISLALKLEVLTARKFIAACLAIVSILLLSGV
jgi:hypothetical protein